MSVFQSDIATANADTRMERPECPQCENPVRHEDVIITARGRGLGGNNRQHIEAHCRNCDHVIVFDREFTGAVWQRVGKFQLISKQQQTAAMQRRRADLEHAIRLEQDETEPGRDYME